MADPITEHAISNMPIAEPHSIGGCMDCRVQTGREIIHVTAIPGQRTRMDVNMQKGCLEAE